MKIEQLKNFGVFEGLNEDELNEFKNVLQAVHIEPGQQFITEGHEGDCIYLLLNGEVEINQALTLSMNKGKGDNREKAIIKLSSDFKPLFGEMSMFNEGDKRTANVMALTACDLVRIDKADLFTICENFPIIGYKVMRNFGKIISKKLEMSNQNVLKLTTAFSLILER
ncbi:MAG: cyclic nucleotide-binding domain-containing protein [Candidatus Neomarinimicrobiota bacterium]